MAGRMLEAMGLVKRFGDLEAVRGISFHIDEGETYGLLGPNGAGKTTSISIVAGLLEADGGSVTVDGSQMTIAATSAKAVIGLVPQELAIYPDLTATENLRFFGRLYGMKGPELADRVAEVLAIIGLTDRADDRSSDFSGGMKRRLNIGIGLLHHPKLLILDEPTVGVDPQSRNAILESVEHLAAEGVAVLYTTHYMEEAERLCDRVAIVDEGEIKAEGTRRELVQMVGQLDRVRIGASGNVERAAAEIRALPLIRDVSPAEGGLELLAEDGGAALPEVIAAVGRAGASVTSVQIQEPDLEAVFLHLTGKALRD